ncbi:MAG: ergothioneine biosynthesis protein EgtB [Gemmatimonadetes bacterium]|nr:ergothioneine biosynthesis protein EgtB [Gemmatimonadota bacterium]
MRDDMVYRASEASRDAIAEALARVRRRTLDIVDPLSEAAFTVQHSPLMSPIAWDLGHIAEFEDLWLVERLGEVVAESALPDIYDAMRTPRSRRGMLDLPARTAILARLEEVRNRTLDTLARLEFSQSDNRLLRDAYVYELVRAHEAQHQETILQTISLMEPEGYVPGSRRRFEPPGPAVAGEMISVPAGPFEMGAPARPFAYDNELPRHVVTTSAFELGRYPVTNGEYLEFVAAGGYDDRMLWTVGGWEWKEEAGLVAPLYWRPAGLEGPLSSGEATEAAREGGVAAWARTTSLGAEPLQARDPVIHVCHHEAEAYARFAGARLPTEAEWEKAAGWDPESGAVHPYPWGEPLPTPDLANLGAAAFGVSPVGAFPAGRSRLGCEQMLGDTWEWTSSRFRAYPGFEAYPYDDYSAVFFGDEYIVLRGGSWATDGGVARNTFRNWDYPIRRQIFAGFRLARDLAR